MLNPQATEEWKAGRRGRLTASRFGDVIAGENTKRRQDYIQEVVWELLGVPDFDDDDKPWFRHGIEWEDEARGRYEWETDNDVELVGSINHPSLPFVSCSPDGLVTDEGGIEIKCRKSLRQHLKVKDKGPDSVYLPQVQGNLWITDRAWWDFVSYYKNPMTRETDIAIFRIYPDEVMFKRLDAACRKMWDEIQSHLERSKSAIRIR